MKLVAALAALALLSLATAAVATHAAGDGVANPLRARQNWTLQCQGCHRADATGTPDTTPAMAGVVARFLELPEGRAYLARVPGVANAALTDAELAELLNWTLDRFDSGHVPANFQPYTAAEIGALRKAPLRIEAAATRAALINKLENRPAR